MKFDSHGRRRSSMAPSDTRNAVVAAPMIAAFAALLLIAGAACDEQATGAAGAHSEANAANVATLEASPEAFQDAPEADPDEAFEEPEVDGTWEDDGTKGFTSVKEGQDLEQTQAWDARAVCDTIRCRSRSSAKAACDKRWGPQSGKPYSLLSRCLSNSTTTNSDCWSDCFRNHCICGSTSGRPNACGAGRRGTWSNVCRCSAHGPVGHRNWCCDGSKLEYDGWSNENYCR